MTRLARLRATLLIALGLCASAPDARADWLVTPSLGKTFGAETALFDPAGGTDVKHWVFGGSGAFLSDQIFGVEADLAWVPGFFHGNEALGLGLIPESRVTTLFGNVIAAVPLAISRESLRPYIIGGLGLVHIGRDDLVVLDEGGNSSAGLQLGGGAIGLVTDRTGVRFDLRQVRTLGRVKNTLTGVPGTRLSFWRASVGVTFRY